MQADWNRIELSLHYTSLVLVQPRKTRPCLTERLLLGHKESNLTNKQSLNHNIKDDTIMAASLFVCFFALRPKSTAMVIAGQSVHLTTLFPGQA